MPEKKRRKTKIICTIGPASESPEVLEALVRSGMNVARINFSYGTFEQHQRKIESLRLIAERLKEPLAILQDLSGPKIRVGKVKAGGVELKKGSRFTLTSHQIMGDEGGVSITYPSLPSEVKPGDRILLSDGTIELRVISSGQEEIECEVVVGGVLTSHNGMNFPGGRIRASAFTEKDHEDLLFGIKKGVDFVGLSYVREASEIERVKGVLKEHSVEIPVIAKIERGEALENIDEIISISDGIMIARGDLGVEMPIEKISNIQKRLIRKANVYGKPVITATQMLRSMVDHTQPTRAEVTDVVNAIYDGTDAVMLSEETARGRFPVESLRMMAKIAESAEEEFPHHQFLERGLEGNGDLPQAISHVASLLADRVGAVAIVTPTESGSTPRWVSRLRPKQPIIALSRHLSTVRRLTLCWGVYPLLVKDWKDTDDMLERSRNIPKELGIAQRGDRIVIIAGVPISIPGTTNLIKVEVVQ